MVTSNIKAHIPCDIHRVWEIISDIENYSVWRSDLRRTEIINEKQFIEYTKAGNSTEFTVTIAEPFKRWEFDMENSNMKGYWIGIFTETGDETEVDFTEHVQAKKLFMKPFVKAYLKKQQAQFIADMIKMKIELRKWSLEDKQSLTELCSSIDRRYLSERLPDPYTWEAADWWLNMVKENEGKNGIFRKIIEDGRIIGSISVEQKEDVYRKDAEIGYFLLPEKYSQGIMSEAVRQICKAAFQELDIIRITGLIYEPNIASRKVLEKNGFVLEGLMKNAVVKNESIYNLCVYGKTKN